MYDEICSVCSCRLCREEVGLTLKYFGTTCSERYCKDCLSEKLQCTVKQLDEIIEYFKSTECPLFI
ncbi:MAG: hypothetical protein IJZ03_08170 [Clostridia bacterium]|nr:hypothetical protein [Clostridia bacterium]